MSHGMKSAKIVQRVALGLTKRKFLAFLVVISLLVLGAACGILIFVRHENYLASEYLRATATAEALLTETHGAEVSKIIKNLELKWHSFEAHINPTVESEIATEPFLSTFGYEKFGDAIYDWPSWSVITSAQVSAIRVIEYTPERIKALASVDRIFKDVTPEGDVIKEARAEGTCGVYVFVRENDVWKLKGFFLTLGNPYDVDRDWENSPWLHEVIGELPPYRDICK